MRLDHLLLGNSIVIFMVAKKSVYIHTKFNLKLAFTRNGGIAQLVERCFCTADVSGSNPLISTKKRGLKNIEIFILL